MLNSKYIYHSPAAIGQRILECRTNLKLSQDDLCAKLQDAQAGLSRQTLSKIENGELGRLTLHQMLAMCEIFNCDIGYLLCEYDSRTITAEQIEEYTGLNEQAIDTLHELHTLQQSDEDERKKAAVKHTIPFINQLLKGRATMKSIGASLNEVAFASKWEDSIGRGLEVPDKNVKRCRDGGLYAISVTITEQVNKLLGNPYAEDKTPERTERLQKTIDKIE